MVKIMCVSLGVCFGGETDQNEDNLSMKIHLQQHTHLWVQLAPAFINGLLSSESINDFSIIQLSQSLVLQPLPLLPFSLEHTRKV